MGVVSRVVLFVALGAAAAFAGGNEELPPIATDRPSESAGTSLVPRGTLQIEMGYKFEREDHSSGRIDTHLLPDLLLRAGLTSGIEGRLTASGWSFKNAAEEEEGGFNDITLGIKWALAEIDSMSFSLVSEVGLPVGSGTVTDGFVNPKLLLLWQKALTNRIGVTANAGLSGVRYQPSDRPEKETLVDVPYTLLVGGGIDERTGWFAELFGTFAVSGRPDHHSFQAGVTYAATRTFQLDVRGGAGLVDDVPTWLVGIGVSIRVPS